MTFFLKSFCHHAVKIHKDAEDLPRVKGPDQNKTWFKEIKDGDWTRIVIKKIEADKKAKSRKKAESCKKFSQERIVRLKTVGIEIMVVPLP